MFRSSVGITIQSQVKKDTEDLLDVEWKIVYCPETYFLHPWSETF